MRELVALSTIELCEHLKPLLLEHMASFERDTRVACNSMHSGVHGLGMQLLEIGGVLAKWFA